MLHPGWQVTHAVNTRSSLEVAIFLGCCYSLGFVPPLGASDGCIATVIQGSVYAWKTINRGEFNVGMMIKSTQQICNREY